MDIFLVMKNDRQLKATIGMSLEEFNELSELFSVEYELTKKKQLMLSPPKQRKSGGGRKAKFNTSAERLYFLLFYLKVYPTFDVLGAVFGMSGCNAHNLIYSYSKILHNVLEKKEVLPLRATDSMKRMKEIFSSSEELLIDGTERPCYRPKDTKIQKECFSGKKKHIHKKIR